MWPAAKRRQWENRRLRKGQIDARHTDPSYRWRMRIATIGGVAAVLAVLALIAWSQQR